jgi:acetyl/propionyl-CoA carboxylase alpha subunit
MKRLVNGREAELAENAATVRRLNGRLVVATSEGTFTAEAVRKGDVTLVSYKGRQYSIEQIKASRTSASADHSGALVSPMPGAVVDVLVEVGQTVKKGDKVIILEAMKTQQTFLSPFNGKIAKLAVSKGEQVGEGLVMAVVEREEG